MDPRGTDRQSPPNADCVHGRRRWGVALTEVLSPRRQVIVLALFVLVGANVRTIILAVPPLLPLIQRDLSLSHTGLALLTAIPVLVMSAGAWPAGAAMQRLGGRACVAAGLFIVALGSILRGVWPSALPLYTLTIVLSLGIALAQTSVVALVRLWFPARIGFASALYTNGIIAGEALGAGLTLPLLGRIGPDAWRPAIAAWGLPVLAVLVAWVAVTPAGKPPAHLPVANVHAGPRGASKQPRVAGRPFWLMAAHLGSVSGCCSAIFFSANAWTAPYNAALGHAGETAASLLLLNAAQLPVALAITPFAQRLTARRTPFVLSGFLCLVAMAGWFWTSASLQPLWATMIGGSSVAVLVLGLALPPYYATPATVARLVGATLTVAYLLSFLGQLAGGRLWDISGQPAFAFLPIIGASVGLVVLAMLLPGRRSTQRNPPQLEMETTAA